MNTAVALSPAQIVARQTRHHRLSRADMVTGEEMQKLLGYSAAAIGNLVSGKRLIQVRSAPDEPVEIVRYPVWQIEPKIFAHVPALLTAGKAPSAWKVLDFLDQPQTAIHGLSGRVALEEGLVADVMRAANALL